MRGQSAHRNSQFGRPTARLLVEKHRSLHAALKIGKSPGKNVQIDPHSVRTHFKLPIVVFPHGIGLEKGFCHIAVPQVVSASVAIGVLEKKQLAEAAFKS